MKHVFNETFLRVWISNVVKIGADLKKNHTNFQPPFHPFRVKTFRNPFLVDVQIMKINICPNFTFLHTAVHDFACILPQSVRYMSFYMYRLVPRKWFKSVTMACIIKHLKAKFHFKIAIGNNSRIRGKMGNGNVSNETEYLTLASQIPSAYPAICGIQRKDKKNSKQQAK